jgi:hypothetical protein
MFTRVSVGVSRRCESWGEPAYRSPSLRGGPGSPLPFRAPRSNRLHGALFELPDATESGARFRLNASAPSRRPRLTAEEDEWRARC